MPMRPWIEQLAMRFDLETEQRALRARHAQILSQTRTAALTTAFASFAAVIVGLIVMQVRIRLAARRHIQFLRRRIAEDLHDEVGSNLATISLLAEINFSQPDSGSAVDISRLARESSLALRDIIDFTLVPKRARKPLLERLREIADLMLRGIPWKFTESGSLELDLETRRNLVFFFKEALHNIIRHAEASRVELHLEADGRFAKLRVADNGVGLPPNLESAPCQRTHEQRAKALGGRLEVRSSAGHGTTLNLTFPIRTTRTA